MSPAIPERFNDRSAADRMYNRKKPRYPLPQDNLVGGLLVYDGIVKSQKIFLALMISGGYHEKTARNRAFYQTIIYGKPDRISILFYFTGLAPCLITHGRDIEMVSQLYM